MFIIEIEFVVKYFPIKKNQAEMALLVKFTKHLEKKKIPVLCKHFLKIEEEGVLPNAFYLISATLIPKRDKDITKKILKK